MAWKMNDTEPIYLQLIEKIQMDIVSGRCKPGDKLPSVRDLAVEAAVNPNTMQKALSELERSGLVFSQRTSGRFITDDSAMIANARKNLAVEEIRLFFSRMKQLGYNENETLELLQNVLKEGA